jgi:hypothetical protein
MRAEYRTGRVASRLAGYLPLFAAANEKLYKQRKCICFPIGAGLTLISSALKNLNPDE